MSEQSIESRGSTDPGLSRRHLLKTTGLAAAASALSGVAIPRVFAAENNTIQVALVGCGGRGSGAASDALSTKSGPIKLVAMADVFEDRLQISHSALKSQKDQQVDVPEDRRFLGFDSYKKAMDCLNPGDIAILATPPAFRWVQFAYAIEKGLNVFMEKPVTVDGPSTRRMLKLGEESVKKNLKVGVGLMCRHCPARGELRKRIADGEMGDLLLLRAYRIAGPTASAFTPLKPKGPNESFTGRKAEDMNDLAYQIRNFHSFLWLSGGAFSDFLIHNIDECCWMKDAWPVQALGFGGRHYRGDYIDQNFDTYTTEYTFADGTKLMLEGRCMTGCYQEFASFAHGTKGAAVVSTSGHWPSRAKIYNGQKMSRDKIAWQFGPERPEHNPYQVEWDDLVSAVRNDTPYNEVKRGAEASLVTAMGRMACHTGQVVKFDEMLNHDHELGPTVDKLTMDGPSPLMPDGAGKYPVPQPGIVTSREFTA